MPDLFEPTDSRRGNRALVDAEVVLEAKPAATLTQPKRVTALEAAPRQVQPLLVFDQVSKWYGPVIGVNQVSLELVPGITGLVGSNGAGKSSMMRLATGQVRPDLGSVKVCGNDAWSAQAKRHIGYSPDVDRLYEEMSGRQFVRTMGRLCGFSGDQVRRRTEEALALVSMTERAHRRLAGYSKGERQRIKVAQALIHDPEVLILDEPLNGIDPVGRQDFLLLFQELANRGKALLVSSHELEELEKLTNHIAVMVQGRIVALGTLTQIRDLLDEHPLAILIRCDRPRELSRAVLGLPEVIGVELLNSDGAVQVRTRQPQQFFRDLAGLVLEEDFEIRHLETMDDSAQAILGYLLGGKR